uniref:NADH-ubiquinone oxidoreductase chain 4L n=1 Tax=Curculionoidea sp. 28 KM-2017 TaxID=2219412 RepID=A0A346RJ70_9CUCU|nr:NADH dehydrogenase subunit 4L [Curculionoidea sp. 28 KM-2017]
MMVYLYVYIFGFMFLSGLYVFVSKHDHFLLMLVGLEFMVLSIYGAMFVYCSYYMSEYFLSLFYLSLTVCEGALGLSLLASFSSSHGKDLIVLLSSLW